MISDFLSLLMHLCTCLNPLGVPWDPFGADLPPRGPHGSLGTCMAAWGWEMSLAWSPGEGGGAWHGCMGIETGPGLGTWSWRIALACLHPGQDWTGQARPVQCWQGQASPGQARPGQSRPGKAKPVQAWPGQSMPIPEPIFQDAPSEILVQDFIDFIPGSPGFYQSPGSRRSGVRRCNSGPPFHAPRGHDDVSSSKNPSS